MAYLFQGDGFEFPGYWLRVALTHAERCFAKFGYITVSPNESGSHQKAGHSRFCMLLLVAMGVSDRKLGTP